MAANIDFAAANAAHRTLSEAGLVLTLLGNRLIVRPEALITDELDQLIREHKPLLMLLRACPVMHCRQLLPWGIRDDHECGAVPTIARRAA